MDENLSLAEIINKLSEQNDDDAMNEINKVYDLIKKGASVDSIEDLINYDKLLEWALKISKEDLVESTLWLISILVRTKTFVDLHKKTSTYIMKSLLSSRNVLQKFVLSAFELYLPKMTVEEDQILLTYSNGLITSLGSDCEDIRTRSKNILIYLAKHESYSEEIFTNYQITLEKIKSKSMIEICRYYDFAISICLESDKLFNSMYKNIFKKELKSIYDSNDPINILLGNEYVNLLISNDENIEKIRQDIFPILLNLSPSDKKHIDNNNLSIYISIINTIEKFIITSDDYSSNNIEDRLIILFDSDLPGLPESTLLIAGKLGGKPGIRSLFCNGELINTIIYCVIIKCQSIQSAGITALCEFFSDKNASTEQGQIDCGETFEKCEESGRNLLTVLQDKSIYPIIEDALLALHLLRRLTLFRIPYQHMIQTSFFNYITDLDKHYNPSCKLEKFELIKDLLNSEMATSHLKPWQVERLQGVISRGPFYTHVPRTYTE